MFKDFVGHNVEILVSFAGTVSGGACADYYFGVVKEVGENFVKLSVTKRGLGGRLTSTEYNGELMEINKKYIIFIKEA